MSTITFDTHKVIEHLIKKGIKKEQAEAIVEAVQQSREFDLNNIATKADIANLKVEMLKWYIATTFLIVGIMISGFAMIINLLKS